ncbi:MAG: hypothetical protein AAFV07_19515 [Bacteroidota bacterium]
MNLDELKQDWQQIGGPDKASGELEQMTRLQQHPALRSVRTRLLMEGGFIFAFLMLYYTALDGDQKPLWVNLGLIGAALIYLGHHVWNAWTLQKAPSEATLINSLRETENRLRTLRVSSLVISAFWGFSLISFLIYPRTILDIPFMWSLGSLVTLIVLLTFSYRIWGQRISQIQRTWKDLVESGHE